MFTYIMVENGIIMTVMFGSAEPANIQDYLVFPYPCDLVSPQTVAGRRIDEYDDKGMLKIKEANPES